MNASVIASCDPQVTTTPVRGNSKCGILLGDLVSKSGDSRMRRVAVLFVASDPSRFVAHELRCRKIGLAQTEVDAVGQCTFEKLRIKVGCRPRIRAGSSNDLAFSDSTLALIPIRPRSRPLNLHAHRRPRRCTRLRPA
jgi:hypothetical protein